MSYKISKPCKNFYINARNGVTEDEKVMKSLRHFENPLLNNWISANHMCLCALIFTKFMAKFCTFWLLHTWVKRPLHQDPEVLSRSKTNNI
jgi:hypothetical protein